MRLFLLVALSLATLQSGLIHARKTCPGGDETDLPAAIERVVIELTTRYFAAAAPSGDEGFAAVDPTVEYRLFDLFQQRYGSGTSTQAFTAGLLDILGAGHLDVVGGGAASTEDHLAAVIGLAQGGNYEAAREETLQMIHSALADSALAASGSFNASRPDSALFGPAEAQNVSDVLAPLFITLRNSLSNEDLELYLNLNVGSTLALVMDITGSMGNEIAAARARFVDIVNSTRGTVDQPLLYVLSPYNSVSPLPVTVTSDPEVIIPAIESLRASGGWESSMNAIYQALLVSSKRSILFHITDDVSNDAQLESRVTALALIRKIRIINLLTRNIRNSSNGRQLYDRVGRATSGLTTVVPRSDIRSVTRLFTALTAQGQVVLPLVDDSSNRSFVLIDPTVGDVTVRMWGPLVLANVTQVRIVRAIGEERTQLRPQVVISSNGLLLLRLSRDQIFPRFSGAETNRRIFIESDRLRSHGLEVTGQSVFGMIPNVKEQDSDGRFVNVLQHRAGRNATVEIKLFGNTTTAEVVGVGLELINGSRISVGSVRRCGDLFITSSFLVPDQPFSVSAYGGYRGGDGSYLAFDRVDPCRVNPLTSNLTIEPIPDQILSPGDSVQVMTRVGNPGGSETISVNFDVSDRAGYVISHTQQAFAYPTVTSTNNNRLFVDLRVPPLGGAADDRVVRVTVTATPPSGRDFVFTTFNVIVRGNATQRCAPLTSSRGGDVKCTDGFNRGSVCSIVCRPGFELDLAAPGAAEQGRSECVNGTWSGQLACRQVGFKVCRIAGDPHYITFDGLRYSFQEACAYTLVETVISPNNTGRLRNFSVQTENEFRGGNRRVSWYKQTFINFDGITINVRQRGRVAIDGELVTLPFSDRSRGILVESTGGSRVTVDIDGIGFRFTQVSDAVFLLRIPAAYREQTRGLCGNMNGDVSDDDVIASNATSSFRVDRLSAPGCDRVEEDGGSPRCENRERYARLCASKLEGACFELCRREIPVADTLSNCIFDMCATDGNLLAYEQALVDYTEQCQLANISVCNWRDDPDTPLPVQCGANAHYEHEASSCPNTCVRPDRQLRTCTSPPRSACVCDEGFLLSGGRCVARDSCGCKYNSRYYQPGEVFLTSGCAARCECEVGGRLRCRAFSCAPDERCAVGDGKLQCLPNSVGVCTGYGDPHYVTFDGRRFSYQGACTYHLVKSTRFQLRVKNRFFRPNVRRASVLESVTLLYARDGANATGVPGANATGATGANAIGVLDANASDIVNVTVYFDERGRIRVATRGLLTSSSLSSPTTSPVVDGYRDDQLSVTVTSSHVGSAARLEYGGGHVTVVVRRGVVNVWIPGSLTNQVDGLCGNFNGNASDDAMSYDDVTARYQVGECERHPPPEPASSDCSDAQQLIRWGTYEYCGVLTMTNGSYGRCLNASGAVLMSLYESCLFDMCVTDGDPDALADILKVADDECRPLLPPCGRKTSFSVICPPNSTYSSCTSACQPTCFDPVPTATCPLPEGEGCVCRLGFILLDGECVPQSECGCYSTQFGYIPPGGSAMSEKCVTECRCEGGGRLTCRTRSGCDVTRGEACVGDVMSGTWACLPVTRRCYVRSGGYLRRFDDVTNVNLTGTMTSSSLRHRTFGKHRLFGIESSNASASVDVEFGKRHPRTNIGTIETSIAYEGRWNNTIVVAPGAKNVTTSKGLRLLPGSDYQGARVFTRGLFTIVKLDFIGLTVSIGHQDGLIISVDGKMYNENSAILQGLCSSKPQTTLFIYRAANATNVTLRPREPATECEESRFKDFVSGPHMCGLLMSYEQLNRCSDQVVGVEQSYESCLNSLSCEEDNNNNNVLATIEASMMGYLSECLIESPSNNLQHRHIGIRNQTGMAYKCGANSRYRSESAAESTGGFESCPASNSSRDSNDELAWLSRLEGCACDAGFLMSGFRCVPRDRCGCRSPLDGVYYQHGEYYLSEGCEERCACSSGRWICSPHACSCDRRCSSTPEGAIACLPVDKCLVDNGGCQGSCRWNARTGVAVCQCGPGLVLAADRKSCVARQRQGGKAVSDDLKMWRESYRSWRESLQDWRDGRGTATDEVCSSLVCDSQRERAEEGGSGCEFYWSEWFNSDAPDDGADDETVARLTALGLPVCGARVAMETKIVSPAHSGSMSGAARTRSRDEPSIRVSDHERGLLCSAPDHGGAKKAGAGCPDFAVRFLCAARPRRRH